MKSPEEPEPPRLSDEARIVPLAILFGAVFGLIALVLIESMRGLEPGVMAAFGFASVLAAAANTPIAAAVMGMELLPHELGVYESVLDGLERGVESTRRRARRPWGGGKPGI